jgi:hypothetical protein
VCPEGVEVGKELGLWLLLDLRWKMFTSLQSDLIFLTDKSNQTRKMKVFWLFKAPNDIGTIM